LKKLEGKTGERHEKRQDETAKQPEETAKRLETTPNVLIYNAFLLMLRKLSEAKRPTLKRKSHTRRPKWVSLAVLAENASS